MQTQSDSACCLVNSQCDLCDNPFPFNCEQCIGVIRQTTIEDTQPKRINVGSGEDCVMAWF